MYLNIKTNFDSEIKSFFEDRLRKLEMDLLGSFLTKRTLSFLDTLEVFNVSKKSLEELFEIKIKKDMQLLGLLERMNTESSRFRIGCIDLSQDKISSIYLGLLLSQNTEEYKNHFLAKHFLGQSKLGSCLFIDICQEETTRLQAKNRQLKLEHEDLKKYGFYYPNKGFVYIIKDNTSNIYKVGMTKGNIKQRFHTLKISNPNIMVYGYYFVSDCRKAEKLIHTLIEQCKVSGEWFSLPIEVLIDLHYILLEKTIDKECSSSLLQGIELA